MTLTEQAAQFLFKAVKKASVNHVNINKGDHIVVTGADDDIIGIVNSVNTIEDTTTVVLDTGSSEKTLQVSSENFIHIIQRADMLNMRSHIDYERDLKDVDKDTHEYTEKDQRPVFGPDEKSDKSELPTSKISLVMKNLKVAEMPIDRYVREVYYFDPVDAIQDILRMLQGQLDLETLKANIIQGKSVDEQAYGQDIYRKEDIG